MPTPDFAARRLVITGDDFGLSPAVNAAVEAYHRAGALHQASLMVGAPQVAEAVEIARRHPALRVGLHLTLCAGVATRPSALTDEAGRLPNSPAIAGLRYAFCPGLHEPLREEIERQFARFQELGFPPTYWDGHTHLHLHPVVFRLTLPIAQRAGFTATRLVREPGAPAPIPAIFGALSAAAVPRLQAARIGFMDRVFGLRRSGRMDLAAFRRALGAAGAGSAEIYFHPGAEAHPPSPAELAAAIAEEAGRNPAP